MADPLSASSLPRKMAAVDDGPLLVFQHCDPGLRFIAQDLTSCTHARSQQFTAVTEGKQRSISEKNHHYHIALLPHLSH
jgi:hypothetical protein